MDRVIVYPGSIPLDTDMLDTNRNTMIAVGALLAATLGLNPIVDGLQVTTAAVGGLSIRIGPGTISGLQRLDSRPYGSLPNNVADGLVKMGINTGDSTLLLTAPAAAGQAQSTLVQATYTENDGQTVALPYYNASSPAQPWLGPANSGHAQPTRRTQTVALSLKTGAIAAAGEALDPPADPGWIGLAVITLAGGQATFAQSDIRPVVSSAGIPFKLGQLRTGMSRAAAFTTSGIFVVPKDVSIVRVTIIGGGGGAGTHPNVPGAGGGAGGRAIGFLPGLAAGAPIEVTVGGGGGIVAAGGPGGSGGSSAFGPYMAATGGQGGGGGTGGAPTYVGGQGGFGLGGDVDWAGDWGGDAIPIATRGGDGGGPGGGRGASGYLGGVPGASFGGGGGGAGSSAPSGGVAGAGGVGASGLVMVEW